jgi:hypothetical protein
VQLSAQVPFEQTSPLPQLEPHVPQLSALVDRSTHVPPHDILPPEHMAPVSLPDSLDTFPSEEVPSVSPPSTDALVLLLLHPMQSHTDATAKTYASAKKPGNLFIDIVSASRILAPADSTVGNTFTSRRLSRITAR